MIRVGVDVGGTNIVVGLVDENNVIVGKSWTPTRADLGLDTLISDIVNCFNNALAFSGYDVSECVGIGIGSPGTCSTKEGTAYNVHHLKLMEIPYCRMITEKTGLKSYLDNDANCAALGEAIAGAAKDSKSALMVTLGTGVGGGFVLDGKIYSGHKSLGGEFGHTCIAVNGKKCACGESGCWDAYASANALAAQAAEAAEGNPSSVLNNFNEITAKDVFDASIAGDITAKAVLENYYSYVGTGIVNFINSIYPEIIVIGGGVSAAGDTLINGVLKYIEKHSFIKDSSQLPKVVKAFLGNDAGIIGAANLCNN